MRDGTAKETLSDLYDFITSFTGLSADDQVYYSLTDTAQATELSSTNNMVFDSSFTTGEFELMVNVTCVDDAENVTVTPFDSNFGSAQELHLNTYRTPTDSSGRLIWTVWMIILSLI